MPLDPVRYPRLVAVGLVDGRARGKRFSADREMGQLVEGTPTSGCGLGAICRPLTSWSNWGLGPCGGPAPSIVPPIDA
jgi:hypothetical protein